MTYTRAYRLVVSSREAISSLMRRERNVLSETMYPYYQDVYDRVLRASESRDSLRDLVSAIVETNLSLRDAQRNEIMLSGGLYTVFKKKDWL